MFTLYIVLTTLSEKWMVSLHPAVVCWNNASCLLFASSCLFWKPELTIDLVALKLLKEQEKAKEKNRRKEKKREKKEKKAALKQLDNSEQSKHELKKRIYEVSATKTPNSAAEQLERSGLTEELELPYATQAADNSPERSQDSNKRRKITPSPGPSQSNNNGSYSSFIYLLVVLPNIFLVHICWLFYLL